MAENSKRQESQDEMDLGQLFLLIGRVFDKFFAFISDLFKGFYSLILAIFIFLWNHKIVLMATMVLSLFGGGILDYLSPPVYISSMIVQPNFESVPQLYNNIEYFDKLADAGKNTALAKVLSITEEQAAAIRSFSIESFSDDNQKIRQFNEFIQTLDSTTLNTIDVKDYLRNFNSMEAKYHNIRIEATDQFVAKITQPAIMSSVTKVDFFQRQKEANDEILDIQEEVHKKQLIEIDSLLSLYKTVMIKTAENPSSGTSISLGGESGDKSHRELSLVQERDQIKKQLIQVKKMQVDQAKIINVVSDFPELGTEDDRLINRYIFQVPFLMLSFVILILLFRKLGAFLESQAKRA